MDDGDDPFLPLGGLRHALILARIRTVEQLARLSDVDLLRINGIRPAHLSPIRAFLAERGHDLARRDDRVADDPAKDLRRRREDGRPIFRPSSLWRRGKRAKGAVGPEGFEPPTKPL